MYNQKVIQSIPTRLRELRRALGYTQRQVADWARMHQNEISRIETGKQDPTLSRVLRIADALGAQLLLLGKNDARLLDTRTSPNDKAEITPIQDARDDADWSRSASRRFDVPDEDDVETR